MPEDEEYQKLMRKYKDRLRTDFGLTPDQALKSWNPGSSREYTRFKKEYQAKHYTFFESACRKCENFLTIKVDPKKTGDLQEAIRISHLEVTPAGITSFSVLGLFMTVIVGLLFSLLAGSMFFMGVAVMLALAVAIIVQKYPFIAANSWRMKASNQMVLCIFYLVTYMRHTSNLENALEFAADHLRPPLALDLKKVLWDVETEKYESVKESLDIYLETWRKWNLEFIEAMHLVESSLYEPTEARRVTLLEKALEVILDETYEKMLHYAHNLQSPITMLHMLGVILPVLGLVILPLLVSFMGGVRWYHLSVLYNIFLPLGVLYIGKNILSTRPTGYGDSDISETTPEIRKYKNIVIKLGKFELLIHPVWLAGSIALLLLFIGLTPLLLHFLAPGLDKTMLDYRPSKLDPTQTIGPFGLIPSLLSLAIPLSLGLGIGLYAKLRSKNIIKIRERSRELEGEFASSLFQFGNRIGDGIPLEIAFNKVAEIMKDTRSGAFFELVSNNIYSLGMSVEDAIFNPKNGALIYFPSPVIEGAMKVLIVSAKKGPLVASQALIGVARYIKEIHKVNERLKDLLADIIASMKSQISFLAPAISGIVVGITAMVTTILGRLSEQVRSLGTVTAGSQAAMIGDMFVDGIPTYYFQIIVGFYVVEIVYILTILANGIENGSDKLNERYLIGANLVRATILYSIISFIVIVIFNVIASQIMVITPSAGA